MALRDYPEPAEALRVIDVFGPSTIQPFVVARHVPMRLKSAIRGVLLTDADDPSERAALDYGLVEQFVPMRDADYDDIRAMLETVEEAKVGSLR